MTARTFLHRAFGFGGGAVVLVLLQGATGSRAQLYRPAVTCEIADFSMTLRLSLRLADDGTGSPGRDGLQGSLEIHNQKMPRDRRLISLDGKRPAQFWNRDGQLKMLLVLGPADDPVTLLIDTIKRDAAGDHSGSFRLSFGDVRLTGRLACMAG